jgi:C4-dicarboxylate transporter DctQ subunit
LTLTGILKQMDAVFGVSCLAAMVLIVLFQIIDRNFFNSGFNDADILVRHLVLWVVFLGAGIASRESRHITIDVLPRLLKPSAKKIVGLVVNLFSTAVSGVLCYAAFSFVRSEYQNGEHLQTLAVPIWTLEIIIPVGYAFITVYFILNGIAALIESSEGTPTC